MYPLPYPQFLRYEE